MTSLARSSLACLALALFVPACGGQVAGDLLGDGGGASSEDGGVLGTDGGRFYLDASEMPMMPMDGGPLPDGAMMPPPMGDGGMMPPPPGDGGMMPPPMGDGGMMPPPPGDGGMMPPPPGDGGMMPPPPGDGGMMPPPPGDGGMMPPPPGDGGMMPPPPGDGGMMPPPPGDGGMLPPPPGDGGMMPPPPGDGGLGLDGGRSDSGLADGGLSDSGVADGGSVAAGDCSLVPVCGGSSTCWFRVGTVAGLTTSCYQSAANGNRWYIHVEATGLPDHAYADPRGQVTAQSYSLDIPLEPSNPTGAGYSACGSEPWRLGMRGIAINGVAIAYPLDVNHRDPVNPPPPYSPEGLDYCRAHPQSTGQYHYHTTPECMYGVYHNGVLATGLLALGPNDPTIATSYDLGLWPKPSAIIGFTLTGYPIYGPYADANGTAHSGLDACNGKVDAAGHYGFYMTETFPYIVGCPGPGLPLDQADWSCTTYAPYP